MADTLPHVKWLVLHIQIMYGYLSLMVFLTLIMPVRSLIYHLPFVHLSYLSNKSLISFVMYSSLHYSVCRVQKLSSFEIRHNIREMHDYEIKWKTKQKLPHCRNFNRTRRNRGKISTHIHNFPDLIETLHYAKSVGVKYRFSFSCPWVTIYLHSRELNFKFNSREWRNIVTHMGNWRRICFSHYLTRTLFQNITDLTTFGERHETF